MRQGHDIHVSEIQLVDTYIHIGAGVGREAPGPHQDYHGKEMRYYEEHGACGARCPLPAACIEDGV